MLVAVVELRAIIVHNVRSVSAGSTYSCHQWYRLHVTRSDPAFLFSTPGGCRCAHV